MVSIRSGRPMFAPPRLSGVSPMLPLKQLQCWSDCRWPFIVISRKIVERFLFLRLSPPVDRWCEVLGFVPAVIVLSSSTLRIFLDASRLGWLLCPPVYLLCHFLWLRHVQNCSTPIGFFEGGCRTLTHAICASHSTVHFLQQAHWICEKHTRWQLLKTNLVLLCPFVAFSIFFNLYCVHFVVPMEFLPWESRIAFPKEKPAATESRYPTLINYKIRAGSFRVSLIHRTLT